MRPALLAFVLALTAGCAGSRTYIHPDLQAMQARPAPDSGEVYQVLLVGDTGAPRVDGTDPVLEMLDRHLTAAGDSSAIVFLGDNIYPSGLPPIFDESRAEAEARLDVQLDMLRDYPGQIFFIPGNHDWADGGPDGLSAVRRQESYIEAALGRGDVFIPSDGFPGPISIDLSDDIRLIAVDSQWWMHPHDKPFGDTGAYRLEEPADLLVELQDLVARSDDKQVLLVAHHPLLSNSSHTGVLSPRYHLFPLARIIPGAYLPLPGLGSAILFYNRILGLSRQDLAHPVYEAYRAGVMAVIENHDGLIYAAGHEHNLQYFAQPGSEGTQHLIVSGSASKSDYVRTGGTSLFASPDKGFVKLRYYADGSVWMESYSPAHGEAPLFRALLVGASSDASVVAGSDAQALAASEPSFPSYADSVVVAAINPAYAAGALRRTLVGKGYRDAWAQPVTLPVLDLGTEQGGLTPTQRGGGAQTRSIRLKNPEGKEFVLRSVDKYPEGALPEAFRFGLALDVAEEMTSAINPFAALIAAPLAEVAGLYHTNPKIVYVPDDPRLGRFREDFRNQPMLLEERPDEDTRDHATLGRSENVIGADKLYRELQGDNDHRVDQHMFVRARLFDLLIGDWDRHRDQWRWASYEPFELDSTLTGDARTMGKIYRPIPRDRDWAFNNRDGVFFKLARPYIPKLQGLQEDYGSIAGLTTNGSVQDQRFLNALSREAWHAQADSLLARLTDSAIEEAVRALPPEVYALDGPEIIHKLKQRRAKLHHIADLYYEARAKRVDIVGSDKHELFEVTRLDDRRTEVVVQKTNSDGEVRLEVYRRVFDIKETDEIRLYGFGGNDRFTVRGTVKHGLLIRLIGGTGEDTYVDSSHVTAFFQPKTIIYDAPTEIHETPEIVFGPDTRYKRADRYPQLALGVVPQRYDTQTPLIYTFSNSEDGIFVGGGFRWVRQGFLKTPYARSQMIRANVAPRTGGFNAEYMGHFVNTLGAWDLGLEASYRSPLSIRNYYGPGNGIDIAEPGRDFYRTRMTQARVATYVSRNLLNVARLYVGPAFTFTRFQETSGRFITSPAADVSPQVFDGLLYGSLSSWIVLDSRDDRVVPRRGFYSRHAADGFVGLNDEKPFLRLSNEMKAYFTAPSSTWLTLATRVGFSHNFGTFPFFYASTLGGDQTLRGYRSDRFSGRTSLYQNAEARVRLSRFSGYVGRGELGLLGFVDNGRVYEDGERSNRWHQGYGGGVWLSVLDQIVFNVQTAFSQEDRLVFFSMGWFY